MTTEREEAQETILSWNGNHSEQSGFLLLPLMWERDATPDMSDGDAQQTINRQLVERADIVIAFFHSRLGTPTGRDVAGTAEEITHGLHRGIPVHVWEKAADVPDDADPAQRANLRRFIEELRTRSLVGSFTGSGGLSRQIYTALTRDLNRLDTRTGESTTPADDLVPGARPGGGAPDRVGESDDRVPVLDAEGEFLWPVDALRRLTKDDRPGATHATRMMNLLVTNIDEYFPTSELIVTLDVGWEEHRQLMGELARIIKKDFPELEGYWPFSYEWRRSTDKYGKNTRQNHYYFSEGQGARWLEAGGGALSQPVDP